MKKLLLILLLPFISMLANAQPCIPDTSIVNPGMYPVNGTSTGFQVVMPDAEVGLMYNEIVQIKAPSDTVIDTVIGGSPVTIPATIDSLMIVRLDNLPSSGSMTFQCDNNKCFWIGGDNGCVVVSGTPLPGDVGTYNIDVVATGWVQVPVLGTLSDTIRFKMELKVVPPQGIDEYISSSSINISPNPFSSNSVFSFQAHKAEAYQFKVIDITGRLVRTVDGKTSLGQNKIMLNREGLPNGLYFYSLEINGHAQSGRIVVSD